MDGRARNVQVRQAVPGGLAGLRRVLAGRRPLQGQPVPALRRRLCPAEAALPKERRPQAAPRNLCANPSFEKGAESYYFQFVEQYNLRRTYRRASFLLTRILADMGVAGNTPLLARFGSPVSPGKPEKRWLDGLYLDQPEAWDDPYRFFCW